MALIVPHPDHKRPLMPYPRPRCQNICGKCCDCRFLGSTAWESARLSHWVGVQGPKPRDTSGRLLSEGDEKAPKRVPGNLRMRGMCWHEIWCYTFPNTPPAVSPTLTKTKSQVMRRRILVHKHGYNHEKCHIAQPSSLQPPPPPPPCP